MLQSPYLQIIMRCFFIVIALYCVSGNSLAQNSVVRQTAQVLDYGQLYSTIFWDEVNTADLRSKLGAALAEKVLLSSTESAWPPGIATLTSRTENRDQMTGYTVYYLCALVDGRSLLVVPAQENQTMPANMQPSKDIYFILLSTVVLVGSEEADWIDSEPEPVQNFEHQMNTITQDFSHDFSNVTNMSLEEDEEGMIIIYGSQVMLNGSTQIYFTEDLYAAATAFHADFPGSTDPSTALKFYQALVQKVAALQLTCCPLSKNEELLEGKLRTQTFNTYDPKGKLDIKYQNMVIEVRLIQGEAFGKEGQLLPEWRPTLDIYGQ